MRLSGRTYQSCHVAAALLLLLFSVVAASSSSTVDSLDFGLADWVNSMDGGYFNSKQEIRREDPTNPNSIVGVFAKEPIAKGELLNQVPWSGIIDDYGYEMLNEELEEDTSMACGTARNLANEMLLGEKSRFAPYILYLQNQSSGQIPSAWSEAGKDLLLELLGGDPSETLIPPRYPVSWLEDDWHVNCSGEKKNALGAQAAMLVVQRADDDVMVPVYDLYNHRNGNYCNTELKITTDVRHQVWAARAIDVGEQIHNSYNLCAECGGRLDRYGTPELFRDYGFVESFPQRWFLREQRLQFDLEENISETQGVRLSWHSRYNPMNTFRSASDLDEFVEYLREQVERLSKPDLQASRKEENLEIPDHELDMIWQYQKAVIFAYSMAFNDLVKDPNQQLPILRDASGACSAES